MKATQNQQQDLLHLHTLSTEIERTRSLIRSATGDPVLEAKRSEQLVAASEVIALHNALEAVDIELRRANEDLALVEQRIARDSDRLNATSSAKDAQGMQNELASLQKRKAELEDITLFVLESQEQASAALAEATSSKLRIDGDLNAIEAAASKEVMRLQSAGSLLMQELTALKARIATEHMNRYLKLEARGVPIGRLVGRDCGACHMALGASAYEAITGLPADEFASCANCSALLVRS